MTGHRTAPEGEPGPQSISLDARWLSSMNTQYERPALTHDDADARLLQSAFLPRVLPHTDTLDVAATYLPAAHAALGGDWYDVFSVDGGICLVIGDVVGHGLAAAAVMGQLRNAIRAYAIEDPSPSRVLIRLNQMMCRLEQGQLASAIVALMGRKERHDPASQCWTSSNAAMSTRRIRVSLPSSR